MKLDERRELHGLDIPALQTRVNEAEEQLLRLRFDAGLKRLSNSAALHATRKRIAVLKTIIREKELVAENAGLGIATMAEYRAYRHAERANYKAHRKAIREAAKTGR